MSGFIMAAVLVAAALLFGAQLLRWLRIAPAQPWPHALAGLGIGAVILGYAILLLGLLSLLKLIWVAAVLAVMLACGFGQWPLVIQLRQAARTYLGEAWRTPTHRFALVFLGVWLVMTLGCTLLPPDSADWDGLSQHLAQAWTYAHESRVRPLWFDHHSQFPCTMQMLFAAGMLVDGYVTARLLHWLLGVLTVIWAVIIAQRFMRDNSGGTSVGVWSALILATTPAFTWLMTVTYVDLGLTFVGLAALHFFLEWVFDRNSAALPLSGLMLGCALTMKMQGIALAGVILFVAAIWAVRQRRGGRQWAVAAAVTLVVGGPWYLKSYLITGDPFYPFAYEVFGGKMWSREQANFYEHHQMAFGYGELPPAEQMQYMSLLEKRFIGPRQPYKWLIGPALLTVRPWDFTVNKRLVIQSFLIEWVGPLYLPLILLLLVWKRPPAIGLIMWLFLPLWLWWFFSMQYTRYLVPALVLLAPVAAFPLSRLLSRAGPVRAAAGTLTAVWAVLSLFQLALNISIAWPAITGQVSWDRYLTVTADVYEPSKYIARYLPQGAVIATYGEPRYYYFQRPAIWADPGHSRLFVYEAMQGPADLIARYRQLGVTHVLINRIYAKGLEGSADWVMTLLREGIKSGLLQPMGSFTHQPQYLLLRVADPRPSPPDAGRPATSG